MSIAIPHMESFVKDCPADRGRHVVEPSGLLQLHLTIHGSKCCTKALVMKSMGMIPQSFNLELSETEKLGINHGSLGTPDEKRSALNQSWPDQGQPVERPHGNRRRRPRLPRSALA